MALFTGIIASLTAALGGGAFAAGFSAFLVNTVAQIATSALVTLIMGKPKVAVAPAVGVTGQLMTGGAVPRQFPVGIGMTAGSLVYANEWGAAGETPNAYFTQVFALSDLPVKGLLAVMVDGVYVNLAGSPHASYGYPVTDYRVNGTDYLWIKFYDGTQTTADSFLTGTVANASRPWGSTRVGTGVAYAICTARAARSLFNGFPSFRFMLDSIKMYDPSQDTTAGGSGAQRWATPSTWGGDGDYLPAVQAYNVLRGISYGSTWTFGFQGMTQGRLPDADWIAAISACRATITGAGGAEPTYRAGGMLSVDATNGDVLDQIMAACAGRVGEAGGIYKPMVGAVGSTVATFTDADIVATEQQSLTLFKSLADTVNSIVAQYPEPDEGFTTVSAPPLLNSTYETADGGRRLQTTLQLSNVPYAEQAQRLAKIALNEARRSIRHTVTLPPSFWALEANDVVEWTSTKHGYTSKKFRIDAVLDRPDSHVTVDITELDAADYFWTTGTDYNPVTVRPPISTPPATQAVPGFALTGVTIDGGSGNQGAGIEIEWDAAQVDNVRAIKWQGRIPSISTTVIFTGQSVGLSEGSAIEDALLPSTAYEVRAKLVADWDTSWTSWTSVTTPSVSSPLPSGTVDLTSTQTISGQKDFTGAVSFIDANTTFKDDADPTKKAQFDLTNITTGTTRTFTFPNVSGIIAALNAAQTFSSKQTLSNANNDLGTSTATGTTNLASGATISGATKTVNIGTGGVSGSTTAITIGSAFGTTTTVQGTLNIPAGTVSLAGMANLAANSIIGNNTGSAATPIALTVAQVVAMVAGGFSETRWCFSDFHQKSTDGNPPFLGQAVSGGTANDPASGSLANAHPGAVLFKCGTTTNGGYQYRTDQQLKGGTSLYFRAVLAGATSHTNTTIRVGLHDSDTSADAVDGAYFEIAGGTAVAKTSSNSTRTTSGTTLALTIDTYYTFDIDMTSGTSVRFRISNDAGSNLYDQTLTTNVPNATGRSFYANCIATNTATVATDLILLDYMGFGPARPLAITVP